jgi:3D (Asp-Asp-Asp) domain-containing protein
MELLYTFAISTLLGVYAPLASISPQSSPSTVNDAALNTASTQSIVSAHPLLSETRTLIVTAYSSSPDETDDSPFITAAGTRVHNGIVATNLFPFGTKIRIPDIFGDRIFVVEDRMHARHKNRIDIWYPSKKEALIFGIRQARVEVVLDEMLAVAPAKQ